MGDMPGNDSQWAPKNQTLFQFIAALAGILLTFMIYNPFDLATAIDSCSYFFAKYEPATARKLCQAIYAGKSDDAAPASKYVWNCFDRRVSQLVEDLASGRFRPQDPEQSDVIRVLNRRLGGPVFPAASFDRDEPANLGIDVRTLSPQVQHLLKGHGRGSGAERRMINRAFISTALGDSDPDAPGVHPFLLWSTVILLLANVFRMLHGFLTSLCRHPRPGEVRDWCFAPAGRLGLFLIRSLVILVPWYCLGVIREGAFTDANQLFQWLGLIYCAFLVWDIAALTASKKASKPAPGLSWLQRRLRASVSFRHFAAVWLASDAAGLLVCLLLTAFCEGWVTFWGRTVQEGPVLLRAPFEWALALFSATALLTFAADYVCNRAYYFPDDGARGKMQKQE